MRLYGKNILMLVSTGVEESEVAQIQKYFAEEDASITITSAEPFLSIDTIDNGRRGRSLNIDLPIEDILVENFHGLVIPDSLITETLLIEQSPILDLINAFYRADLPIFASGRSIELLYESRVFPQKVLVRDTQSMQLFLEQAIGMLLDRPVSYPVRLPQPVTSDD